MRFSFTNHQEQMNQRALWLFVLYRIVLSTSIFSIFIFYPQYSSFGSLNAGLFETIAFWFTILTYLSAFIMLGGVFSLVNQTSLMIFIDIVAITLLTYASGGVGSGLGAFIAVTIAIGSVIISSHLSLSLAAIASSLLLSQEIYLHQVNQLSTQVSKAGMLGLAYFAIAILAYILSKRAWESEKKALIQKQELQKMARLNEQIVQHMNSGVIVINQHDHVFLSNNSALKLLNLKQSLGRIPLSYYSSALARFITQWRTSPITTPNTVKPLNSSTTLQITVRTISEQDHSALLLLINDAEQVTKQAQQLKLASLGQLTASIAHEIRNPLCSIGHASQLLSESEQLLAEDRRLLEIIINNVTRLNDVIENILQMSRLNNSEMNTTNLLTMLTHFIEHFIPSQLIDITQLQLIPFNEKINVLTNSQQIQQVLTVLCENAINHYHNEIHLLMIKITGDFDEQGYFYIQICDNGKPIDSDLSEKIFEPFYSTKHSGTGLGLYVAKGLCEANSARLDYIKSKAGNCFVISFHPTKIIDS